jgi:hypothetical protein
MEVSGKLHATAALPSGKQLPVPSGQKAGRETFQTNSQILELYFRYLHPPPHSPNSIGIRWAQFVMKHARAPSDGHELLIVRSFYALRSKREQKVSKRI